MLEEAVKNDKANPAEVADALLQFIRNEMPAGGTSAETRFLRMYQMICNRIFGPILDGKDGYKHGEGGWLGAATQTWRKPSSTSGPSGTATSPSKRAALERDPVVELLATSYGTGKDDTAPTLVEAISKESANRPSAAFPFPFLAFPENFRTAWLALVDASLSRLPAPPIDACSTHMQRLLTELLRRSPLEQQDLLAYKQSLSEKKDASSPFMQLSPRGFPLNSPQTTVSPGKEKKPVDPNVVLGMLEYYLFLFVRYPLAKPVPKATVSSPGVNRHRVGFVGRRTDTYGDSMYYYLFDRYLKHFLNNERADLTTLSRESELFLHVIVGLWLESQGRCQTTEAVVNRRFRGDASTLNLSASYDLVQVKYDPPSKQVQRCILSLVRHVILDPMMEVREGQRYVLPKAMSILQQPLYNYIRASFRHGGIHDSSSPLYTALEVWLTLLEPWNVEGLSFSTYLSNADNCCLSLFLLLSAVKSADFTMATQRIMRSNSPRSPRPKKRAFLVRKDFKSRYTSRWEAYLATNLHLYTVPLALFLRRARELDFSAPRFKRSLETVRRVFRVYTPEVINSLDRLLRKDFPEYAPHVQQHLQALSSYAPPEWGGLTLSSCQDDMKILLEEIKLQHQKTVGQLNVLERTFGAGQISGEEKGIDLLVKRAYSMVKLPSDYKIAPQPANAARNASTVALSHPRLVDSSGRLTEDAKYKVYAGEIKCDPADVVYDGDIMQRRLETHEIQLLVDFLVELSETVHIKTGYKVNLRYFANWHHLLWFLVGVWLVGFFLRLLIF